MENLNALDSYTQHAIKHPEEFLLLEVSWCLTYLNGMKEEVSKDGQDILIMSIKEREDCTCIHDLENNEKKCFCKNLFEEISQTSVPFNSCFYNRKNSFYDFIKSDLILPEVIVNIDLKIEEKAT